MSKLHIDEVLVVEGKMDKQLLEQYIDGDIITTNGSAISDETISLLKELSKTRRIIVFTDPDFPGKQIRNKIDSEVECIHCFIEKEKAIKGKKVGVAETNINDLLEVLKEKIVKSDYNKGNLTINDLNDLGLNGRNNSSYLRDELSKKLHIDHCNAKMMVKRLNMLGITKEQLKEIMEGLYENCDL